MPARPRSLVLLLLAVALPAAAVAQITPEEQARRLLEDGRAAWRDGKVKQAVDNFNTIVSGFPGTSSVDDALLEIGRYWAEIENDPVKARESFEQVAQRFPQSDGAPGAYWQLGWLTLRSARTPAELDDAVAQFTRVQRLYPRSRWVPNALYATALAHRRAARWSDAVAAARRVVLEYPGSDIASAAQFEVGQSLALMGRHEAAMEAFQQVRNRWPDSELAAHALDRTTAIWRLHGSAQPAFRPDPSFSVGAGEVLKDVRALLAEPGGTLWIASDKVSAAVPFGADGKMGASMNAQDPKALSLGSGGEVVLASPRAVRVGLRDIRTLAVPGDKPGAPEPLEKIAAAVLLPSGGLLAADEKRKRVFRFDAASKFEGTFPDGAERQVVRLVLDPEGSVLMLDKDARSVTVVDKTGRVARTIGPTGAGFSFRKPVDLAVDAFGNLYVADEDGGVWMLDPSGRFLGKLQDDAIRKPKAVTVQSTGAVLVYDDKTERIVRFR